ncbi:POK25 protein, partial [Locustella ochotensis]|nr:POK25 protein [Locustella ochotensis]
MGALQPGMPAPTMIPQGWNIVVIDLKDCFFTISLHPQNTQRFAFTRACNSHETFHQNARALHRQFQIPLNDAQEIVHARPQCSHHGPDLG